MIIKTLLKSFHSNEASHPALLLGQFERVGSTFLLDNYELKNTVYNEPYKQLVPESWPIARGFRGKLYSSSDDFLQDPSISALNKLWTYNFVISKYVPSGQIIKETNLYFALPIFLSFFPYRKIELLSRHPLGIIGSFTRNDLFHAWSYSKVIETLNIQLQAMPQAEQKEYSFFLDQATTDWRIKILRLVGLNSVFLTKILSSIDPSIRYYDEIIQLADNNLSTSRDEDSIFGTNFRKEYDDFDKRLDDETIDHLYKEANLCILHAHSFLSNTEKVFFDKIFSHYFTFPFIRKSDFEQPLIEESKPKNSGQFALYPVQKARDYTPKYVQLKGLPNTLWDTSLVTNTEMGKFLQLLLDNGLSQDVLHLLLREQMIPERGGRLLLSSDETQIMICKGYEHHPVYWISWLGAACYALFKGCSLPNSEDWMKVFDQHALLSSTIANHSYTNDDVIVSDNQQSDNYPSDFFGNLKIWCSDWADDLCQNKKLAGISWKHYFKEGYRPITEKPYMTNSRVIGARLIVCKTCGFHDPKTAAQIVHMLESLAKSIDLSDPTLDTISKANQQVANELSCSLGCTHSQK